MFNPNLNEYEVPIVVDKQNIRARNPKYDVIVYQSNDSFNFKIVRLSTETVM